MSIASRLSSLLAPVAPPMVTVIEPEPVKAVTGFGATALTYSPPVWSLANTPQRKARQAALLFATHDSIHKAETSISDTGGSVGWHLEYGDEETVDDTSAPNLKAIRDLLRRPQSALPLEDRQPGMGTFRQLLTTTLRHTGLCGTAFWYLDQTEALGGTPLAILYIAPWRLFEVRQEHTLRFLGWTLDKSLEEGGRPVEYKNVLPFYLHPPDQGMFATGLVEAAAGKVPLAPLIDRHIARVISSGGRLAGLLSPKVGSTVTEDNWKQFVSDYRGITQSDDAALRLQIVQGPVDFVKTAADMNELAVIDIDERTDNAIRELWGVPGSQTGADTSPGLNSGSTKGYDEAVLWQKAIHPRLVTAWETIQYDLLERYKAIGTDVTMVFEEPEFDDESPMYAMAVQAAQLPLTVKERRAILGLDPFGDKILDDRGRLVDDIVYLPSLQTEAFYANETLPEPEPEPVITVLPNAPVPQLTDGRPPTPVPARVSPAGKAQIPALARLRESVDRGSVAAVKKAVSAVLEGQRASIVRYLQTVGLDHLRRKSDFRWDAKAADAQLEGALTAPLGAIVKRVANKTHSALSTQKATALDEFTERVVTRVLTKGAGRVKGINRTTRDAVQQAIAESVAGAENITDVIAAVEALDIFGELRAETIARTESMFAYNDAALGSYAELGVTEVQAIDGDEDEECAARDGQTYSVEEAESITDHPNGTLDWVPIIPDEPAPQKATRVELERDEFGRVIAITERVA